MPDNRKPNSRTDKKLNELLKAACETIPDDIERPSSASIEAYLLGSATSSQEQEVRTALIGSDAFRRELLAMAEDIESLTDSGTEEAFDRAWIPDTPLPSLRSFLDSADSDEATGKDRKSGLTEFIVPEGLARLLRKLFVPGRQRFGKWMTTSSLVASALLVALIMRMGYITKFAESEPSISQISEWVLVSQMDIGMFESNVTREPSGDHQMVNRYATHADAAQAEFMRLVRYENGYYAFDTTGAKVVPDEPVRQLLLSLVEESGDIVTERETSLPATQEAALSARIWTLAIPSRTLRYIEVKSDTVSMVWDHHADPRCCVTVTYAVDSMFAATDGVVIEF